MIWRKSLPARLALSTAGMLSVVLLLLTGSTYFLTAILIQRAVDSALMTALPLQSRDLTVLMAGAEEFERGAPGARLVQVVDAEGEPLTDDEALPVDERALAQALRGRVAFASAVPHDDDEEGDDDKHRVREFEAREGSSWWQAMTPQRGEIRVIYIPARVDRVLQVLQVGMPLGPSVEVLPQVLRAMLLLSALAILIVSWITFYMAGATYRPLREIMRSAGRITTKNLAVRIPDGWHDETLHQLTQVLNAMIARLQESFEAQGRFVASAAHELRGPLAAMRAELEVTLRRSRTPEEYEQALNGALEETARLTALSEHLLVLARYERGASMSMETDLPLTPLLQRAGVEVARSTGGEVRVEAEEGLTLTGDPIALERMVANLARNGVEAGGAPVVIEAGRGSGHIWIAVCDHGPGIPPETVPLLFEPFYRADPARRRDAGVGLGLAIVKTIVEAHRGEISVEPAAGGGTRFLVKFPRT